MMKLFYSLIFSIFLICTPALAMKSNHGLDGYIENQIDAKKNARLHNNMGNIYFDEKKYFSALAEYQIAFNLDNESQSSGVYLYNIARTMMILKDYSGAKRAIEGAIFKDCMNITYYTTLVDCLIKLNIEEKEITKYINDNKNPYNRIIVGLIYLKTNKIMQARATFDDFLIQYPDMQISDDIRAILNNI